MNLSNYILKFKDVLDNLTLSLNETIQLSHKEYHYSTFGKDIEPLIVNFFKENKLLKEGNFKEQWDNKNATPDLIDYQLEKNVFIDFKAGNIVKYKTGIPVKNANQDISTLKNWKEKILKEFDPEYCFLIEVKYEHSTKTPLKVMSCEFDNFYKFIGKTSEGLISYRKKDGCVRPKNWDSCPKFKSGKEFVNLIPRTLSKRALAIIEEKILELEDEDKNILLGNLSAKLQLILF